MKKKADEKSKGTSKGKEKGKQRTALEEPKLDELQQDEWLLKLTADDHIAGQPADSDPARGR